MAELDVIPGWLIYGGVKYAPYNWREKSYNINECHEKFGNSVDVVGHRNNRHPRWYLRNTCYGINNLSKNTKITTWPSGNRYAIDEPLPNDVYDRVHTMACTNGGKIKDLCKFEDYYVNPLGDVKTLDYKNSVSKLSKNYNTVNERVKDSIEKINLANIELIVLASSLGISIIVLIVLLRNLK